MNLKKELEMIHRQKQDLDGKLQSFPNMKEVKATLKTYSEHINEDFKRLEKILNDYEKKKLELSKILRSIPLNQIREYAHKIIDQIKIDSLSNFQDIFPSLEKMLESYINLINETNSSTDIITTSFSELMGALKLVESFSNTKIIERHFSSEITNFLAKENEIKIDEDELLEYLLNSLDQNLLNMWQGALFALSSSENNPDFIRHFSVSLRTLVENVINLLANDTDVIFWLTKQKIPEDQFYVKNENKIQRRWKILYIYRGKDYKILPTNNDCYINFKDDLIQLYMKSLIDGMKQFSKNVHTEDEKAEDIFLTTIQNIKSILFSLILNSKRKHDN